MHTVSFPIENSGIDADEVTIAEVLSETGYATTFYGKWHLGDTEPSYCHNQGFDEAFFTPYNQVPSMWLPQMEMANSDQFCTGSKSKIESLCQQERASGSTC